MNGLVPECIRLDPNIVHQLRDFENSLDPAHPEAGGHARVLGYGEMSAALVLSDLPGQVCKRMVGFPDTQSVEQYAQAVSDYLAELRTHRVTVAETRLAVLETRYHRTCAYLVQPLLPAQGLAANLLRHASDEQFLHSLHAVLETAARLLRANAHRGDGRTVTVDAQLSNWWFDLESGGPPVLIDVGTPFMRRHGIDECGTEFFLAPVPGLLRGHYRRQRAVQKYIDDYFSPRLLALDLLGNFHKEGRPDRIDLGIQIVNAWLSEMEDSRPIQRQEVDDYYRKDAADLELYLRIRRIDRWLHRYVLHRPYPFILPGTIRR